MSAKSHLVSSFLFFISYSTILHRFQAQPSTQGFTCTANRISFPCQTYAFYRATAPIFLDLSSVGDLFSVSRLMISKPSNLSSPTSPLIPNQPLFVPLSCSCNTMNGTSISFANITYTIKPGDTFYFVSTEYFGNLTTYQSVQLVNPALIPTLLQVGAEVIFPIFCKCPNQTQLQNKVNYLVSYVFQPSDNLSSVASTFGVETQSIVDANGNNIQPFDTIFIPVNQLPRLAQPTVVPSLAPSGKTQRKGLITGLAVGLGTVGLLLVLVSGVWFYRDGVLKTRRDDQEKQRMQFNGGGKLLKDIEVNLMADVSDCLDKYRVFKIDELKEATDGFSVNCLIEGSVFKGSINGETDAIKKMKWNACEELKILHKVRSFSLITVYTPAFTVCLVSSEVVGSRTRLHKPLLFPYSYSKPWQLGEAIDPEDANCYLVYEYIDNGSLHSWLHGNEKEKKQTLERRSSRLRKAIGGEEKVTAGVEEKRRKGCSGERERKEGNQCQREKKKLCPRMGEVSQEIKRVRAQMEENEDLAILMRGLRGQNLRDTQFADDNIKLLLVEVDESSEFLPLVYEPSSISAYWGKRPRAIATRASLAL
ncbi:hypothetical protein DKX38_015448 [Salix brachista]|uniref:LysM domain-containing protein n=1 Tax=Salix brachista TaxID=2182728 RepID=A0A5N5L580_9ROSI|nr:hypothetical protein DKX38_015448 [Salix brachista]